MAKRENHRELAGDAEHPDVWSPYGANALPAAMQPEFGIEPPVEIARFAKVADEPVPEVGGFNAPLGSRRYH